MGEKNVNLLWASKKLFAARLGLSSAVSKLFLDIAETDTGPLVRETDLQKLAENLFDNHLMPGIRALIKGELPEVTEPDLKPEPTTTAPPTTTPAAGNVVKIMNTGDKMSWNSYYYDKFVFPKCGPEYTSRPFTIVYSDGNRLYVDDPTAMRMTPDNMKYQPGGKWSGNNPDIPTMEVYARRDTHPEWVMVVFDG